MNRLAILIPVLCFLFLVSCEERKTEKKVHTGAIYADYRIWGDEGGGNVSVKLQYSLDDADGTTIELAPPASVSFDGEMLGPDSSHFNGIFYELLRPADGFAGEHEIAYTDSTGKIYKTSFNFPVFRLKTPVPAEMTRGDMVFQVEGLQTGDRVRLFLVDTTFTGRGLERIDTLENGEIHISKTELDNLQNGPVNMSITWEEDKKLDQATAAGGKIYTAYSLKREFILKDAAPRP